MLIDAITPWSRKVVSGWGASEAVVQGIWHQIDGCSLLAILVCSMVLLTVVLVINSLAARWLGFNTADEITIVFCGSKKSLANGIPMANVLFSASVVGVMVSLAGAVAVTDTCS